MKKIITISVDIETFIEAQEQLGKGNISSYLNECLSSVTKHKQELKTNNIVEDIENITKTITELSINKSLLLNQLHNQKKVEQEQVKLNEEKEKFKRWKCGVCKHINFMDAIRCGNCQLPTKESNKTETIFINEE